MGQELSKFVDQRYNYFVIISMDFVCIIHTNQGENYFGQLNKKSTYSGGTNIFVICIFKLFQKYLNSSEDKNNNN